MKKSLFILLIGLVLFVFQNAYADDSLTGLWTTIDDDGKTAKSHVEIYEKDGLLYGKIVKLLQEPQDKICEKCPGDKKGKPLVGMEIISGLKLSGGEYSGGEIMDPANGKKYRCKLWREGNELKVRGYLAFFFRTQTWHLTE